MAETDVEHPEAGRRYWLYALIIPAIVVVFDQITKYWSLNLFKVPYDVCATTPPRVKIELSPIMDFSLFCNRGVSFSMFNDGSALTRWILTAFAAVMVVVLLVWLMKSTHKLQKLAIALVIGGAIGNGIDRVLYGAVIDFIDFSDVYFSFVFNIADSAITCGVIGLLIHAFFFDGKPDKGAPDTVSKP